MAKPIRRQSTSPLAGVIAARMRELGLTSVAELARVTGLPRTMLYFAQDGRVSKKGTTVVPSVATLVVLARALNRPAHELLYLLIPEARDSLTDNALASVVVVGVIGCLPDVTVSPSCSHVARPRDKGDFTAFEMLGDAMDGGQRPIAPGAFLVVNVARSPKPGDLVVGQLSGGALLCRLMRRNGAGSELICSNPAHTEPLPSCVQYNELENVIGVVHQIQQTV